MSLIQQDFKDWEMIIVASPSSDDTLINAKSLEKSNPKISLFYEEQKGIYKAMNVGLEKSSSKYVWFMNSGDIFANSRNLGTALETIKEKGVGVLLGGYIVGGSRSKTFLKSTREIGVQRFSANIRGGCHQSMLYLRAATPVSGYNLVYELASDFDFTLQSIATAGAYRINAPLAIISPGGITHSRIFDVLNEKQSIRKDFFGSLSLAYLFGFYIMFGVKAKLFIRSLFGSLKGK
jgi:glycosyltransferase involved in cell wall biosynthesis